MTNGPCPEKRAQKCAGDFWFVIILSGAKKMFSEPNINTSPLLEKGAKGREGQNKKYFEKNHFTRLLLIPHPILITEQNNIY